MGTKQRPPTVKAKLKDASVQSKKEAEMEKLLAEHTIGVAQMNTVDPPRSSVALHFGSINPRPLNPSAVRGLLKSYSVVGRNPNHSVIYVAVDPDWLKPGTFVTDVGTLFEGLPQLQFTNAADGQTIEILSGHHRTESSRVIRADMQLERDKLQQKRLALISKSLSAGDTDAEKFKPIQELVAATGAEISQLDDEIATCVFWKVQLVNKRESDLHPPRVCTTYAWSDQEPPHSLYCSGRPRMRCDRTSRPLQRSSLSSLQERYSTRSTCGARPILPIPFRRRQTRGIVFGRHKS